MFKKNLLLLAIFFIIAATQPQSGTIYLSSPSPLYDPSLSDGSASNPYINLSQAIESGFNLLQNEPSIYTLSFLFLGDNFTVFTNISGLGFFEGWETLLNRNISINMSPNDCKGFSECASSFILILKTQNLSFFSVSNMTLSNFIIDAADSSQNISQLNCPLCCQNQSFYNSSNLCFIANFTPLRNSKPDRSLFELAVNGSFYMNNITIRNLYSLDNNNYYSYLMRTTLSLNIFIQNCQFQGIYMYQSLIKISSNSNVQVLNCSFQDYNPFNFIENIAQSTFSFVFNMDSFIESNITCSNTDFQNIQFVIYSNAFSNYFMNCRFFVKIRTTTISTFSRMTGFLYFGTSVSTILVKNCSFLQGNPQTNLIGINRIALIFSSAYSNITLMNSFFSNLVLREARILMSDSYSQIMLLGNLFININHTCYENPSSNCLYYLFDFRSYSNINILNNTLINVMVSTDAQPFNILSLNNVNFINLTITNAKILNNPPIYLVSFFSTNTINIVNMMAKNYTIGFSGGFFYFDNHNVIIFNSSIFVANNPSTLTGQIIFLSSTNTITCTAVQFANMCSLFRNNFYVLTSNNVLFNGCYLSNITGSRGGVSSIANNHNLYVVNNSVLSSVSTVNQGSLVYVINSGNVIKLLNSKFLDFFAQQDGGVAYIENSHTLIMDQMLIFNPYANMYGGVISTLNSNTFSIQNTLIILSSSQSNGGFIYTIQNNKIAISNTSFIQCSSTRSQGGVIFAFQNNSIVMQNITLTGNSAEQEGGCFFLDNNNLFNLSLSTISNSSSNSDAGFLMTKQNNTINISQCVFNNTQSNLDAGLLKAQKLNNITLQFLDIVNSKGVQNGGVFFLDTSNIFMFLSSSISASSSIKGGIFCLSNSNNFIAQDCNFLNSQSNSQGGGFWGNNMNNITFNNCHFSRVVNFIGDGGLLFLNYNNLLRFTNCQMADLATDSTGGFIYGFENNTMSINSCGLNDTIGRIEGSFISLNYLNTLNLTDVSVETNTYYGMFYFLGSNSFYIHNFTAVVSNASINSYFIFLSQNNLGSFINCSFIWNGSFSKAQIFFLAASSQNNVSLTGTPINFDSCYQLVFLNGGSYLFFRGFTLKNFSTASLFPFIQLLGDSKLISKEINFKNTQIWLLFYAMSSIIEIRNFTFVQMSQQCSFMEAYASQIIVERGYFRRSSSQNHTQTFLLSDSIVSFKSIEIIGFSYIFDGGFGSFQNSSLTIQRSLILLSRSWNSGGVFALFYSNISSISNKYYINVTKSIGAENKAFANGSFLYSENLENLMQKFNLSIKRSSFKLNQANRGGVLYTINTQQFSINNSKFQRNSAQQLDTSLLAKGGIVFFYTNQSKPSSKIIIQNSNFTKNKASVGAILYTDGLQITSMLIRNNSGTLNLAAFYGNEWASETYELRFMSLTKDLLNTVQLNDTYFSAQVNDIKTGSNSGCLMTLNGYDRFGSITYQTDENLVSMLDLVQTSSSLYSNSLKFSMSQGFVCLNSPIIREQFPIDNSFQYHLMSSLPKSVYLRLDINFKPCGLGERLSDSLECTPCQVDTYSFQTDFMGYSQICQTCNDQNFYCFGGGNYTPQPGFWRGSSQSRYFYKCLNTDACLGDPRVYSDTNTQYLEVYATGVCGTGYKGILCSICADGYGATDNFKCGQCRSDLYYLQVLGNLFLRILFSLYLINIALNMCLTLMGTEPNIPRVIATNLLKILTNHMQILGIILKFPIYVPNQIVSAAGVFLSISPNVSEAFSIECILKAININVSLAYFKLIIAGIYPIFLVLIYLSILQALKNMKCSGQYSGKQNNITAIIKAKTISYRDLVQTIFALVCLTCYADIANMALSMFGCVNINDGTQEISLLYFDMNIECNGSYHQKWIKQLSIPIIIFFMALYPASIIFRIFNHLYRSKSEPDSSFFFKFGYFFYAYQRRFFFWDFVILVRKLLLIFINNFFFNRVSSNIQQYPIIIVLLIITLAYILQNYCKPFQSDHFKLVNGVEEASLMVSFLTVSCLLTMILASGVNERFNSFLFYVAIIINLWFFYWWTKNYYRYYFKKKVVYVITKICGFLGVKKFKEKPGFENVGKGKEEAITVKNEKKIINYKVKPNITTAKKIKLNNQWKEDDQRKESD